MFSPLSDSIGDILNSQVQGFVPMCPLTIGSKKLSWVISVAYIITNAKDPVIRTWLKTDDA